MGNFFAELKRRHIYRVAAAYAVVAWIILQLVNNVAPVLDLPVWIARAFLLLLVAGFPVALFFAWVRELAPLDSPAKTKAGAADWMLAAVAAGMIAIFAYQELSPPRTPSAVQPTADAAREAAAKPAGISVAVLPFDNISGDASQEFFSTGMTEEITSALARVPDLRVVARTSAYQFKAQNRDIQSIGQQLHATHFIEGSVRKAGDRVRITAQLIKADDGTHLWAEDFDRRVTDIFAVQEEIARAIATSLRTPLGLKPGDNLVNNRNIDSDSYEAFLRARAIYESRGGPSSNAQAASLLQGVVTKYPDYAPGWMWLSGTYFTLATDVAGNVGKPLLERRAELEELRSKGEAAAQRAIKLDPSLAQAHVLLGSFAWSRGKTVQADEFYKKALALDPNDGETLFGVGTRLGYAGRLNEALALIEKDHALEPFAPGISLSAAHYRWLNGQHDAAIALAKTLRPADRVPILAMIYASLGRYAEAADALMEIAKDESSIAAQAARLLRSAPATSDSPERLPALPNGLDFVYLYVGAPDRAIDLYERRAEVGFVGGNSLAFVWHPSYAPVRKTERFKALMRKVGLVEYWRAKGWAEFCHPTTADDFECE